MPKSVTEFLESRQGQSCRVNYQALTIMWNLRSERNMRTLDGGEQSNFVIKVSFEALV